MEITIFSHIKARFQATKRDTLKLSKSLQWFPQLSAITGYLYDRCEWKGPQEALSKNSLHKLGASLPVKVVDNA